MALKRINKELTDLGRYVLSLTPLAFAAVLFEALLARAANRFGASGDGGAAWKEGFLPSHTGISMAADTALRSPRNCAR